MKNIGSYSLLKRHANGDRLLTRKEIAILRQAKRVGTSLEATARAILLLRAKKKAIG